MLVVTLHMPARGARVGARVKFWNRGCTLHPKQKEVKSMGKKLTEIERQKRAKKAAQESKIKDCLNEDDRKKIDKALRKVWSWSHSRRLVVKRCDIGNGYSRCEGCLKKCPKVFIDHIRAVGTFDEKFISRLFVPSNWLQGLCHPCHKIKTKLDLQLIKRKRIAKEKDQAVDYNFF